MRPRFSKQCPLAVRNFHRSFWGLKPLRPSRKGLPPKQAEVLSLLDQNGPMTEEALAGATRRRKGRALAFLFALGSRGLVELGSDDRWRAVAGV